MRVNDWESRLQESIEAAKDKKFSYGSFDCCIFAASCIKAITNIDILREFRAEYFSRTEAVKLIRKKGYLDFEDAADRIAKRYGWPEVSYKMLQRGDATFVRDESNFLSLAIVDMSARNVLLPKTTGGLASIPTYLAVKSWRIG